MRLREVAEAEKQQMMKARQQRLLEGQQVIHTHAEEPVFPQDIPYILD